MKKAGYLLLAVIVVAAAAGIGYWKFTGNPDALRQIVLQQCLPHQLQQQDPAPCAEVKPDAGYVVFKDRNGPLQYLLMPTWRINGTESPLLLKSGTPNFFWLAWQARSFMSQKYGQEIAAKNFYRPRDAEVAKKYENAFPKLKLFTIDEEFGGWTKAQKEHFSNGGTFDQISQR